MNKLKVDLNNCYGIKHLKCEFDFSNYAVAAVYAPNGSMKSSFARTFNDLKKNADSGDRYWPAKPWSRKITDENGADIPGDKVFVITPYDDEYEFSNEIATLLINKDLKKEYAKITKDFSEAKKQFLKGMKELSGSKKDLEKEISSALTPRDDQFELAITRIKNEVIKQTDAMFSDVVYDEIFNDDVMAFLSSEDVRADIRSYLETYNRLLGGSTYFKKGIFNYYNAATIAKTLEEHGFFRAQYSVNMNAELVNSRVQLEKIIEDEKIAILANPELKKKWESIHSKINTRKALRDFDKYLSENETLIPHLENLADFKEKIWKSYFKTKEDSFLAIIDQYEKAEVRMKEIEGLAEKHNSIWEEVVAIFNDRFLHLPFRVEILNRTQVLIGQAKTLQIGFKFLDGDNEVSVLRDKLVTNLSTGEKKALYILYLIFDIETRKASGEETIFVVDDIADSFDYKNKYAIIEYLKDISEVPDFYQIILTHNFDFFRTITSRNVVHYSQCRMAFKTNDGGVELKKAAGIKNVFVNIWKEKFFTNGKMRIASIPFIRNIIEYTKGPSDEDYIKMTKLLHWMDGSSEITEEELGQIFGKVFNEKSEFTGNKKKVMDLLSEEAASCLGAEDGINFENKIVLSIAIRIAAEQFMMNKISNKTAVAAVGASRTPELLKLFKTEFGKSDVTRILDRVVLMTPENIHLNSFMYEPILDMSDAHLKKLYGEVLNLSKLRSVSPPH